jgi:hypothetical protein
MEMGIAPQVPATVPTMTIERFSQRSGLDKGMIQGHMHAFDLNDANIIRFSRMSGDATYICRRSMSTAISVGGIYRRNLPPLVGR